MKLFLLRDIEMEPVRMSVFYPVNEYHVPYQISDTTTIIYYPNSDRVEVVFGDVTTEFQVSFLKDFACDIFTRPTPRSESNEMGVIHRFIFTDREAVKRYLHEKYGLTV